MLLKKQLHVMMMLQSLRLKVLGLRIASKKRFMVRYAMISYIHKVIVEHNAALIQTTQCQSTLIESTIDRSCTSANEVFHSHCNNQPLCGQRSPRRHLAPMLKCRNASNPDQLPTRPAATSTVHNHTVRSSGHNEITNAN